jgi:hypothetical protein
MSMETNTQFGASTLVGEECTGVRRGLQITLQSRRTTGSAHPHEGLKHHTSYTE